MAIKFSADCHKDDFAKVKDDVPIFSHYYRSLNNLKRADDDIVIQKNLPN
jgi:hypothetical protein